MADFRTRKWLTASGARLNGGVLHGALLGALFVVAL